MKCDGFRPAEPIRLRHRLALADLEIVWDDGDDDVILGIVPVMRQCVAEVSRSAAYDLSVSLRMLGDDHPRLRPALYWIAGIFNKFGIGV